MSSANRLRSRWRRISEAVHAPWRVRPPWDSQALLREELFSVERLEAHAASLAAAQPVGPMRGRRRTLHARLRDNETVLLAAYRATAAVVASGRTVTPAAEWLLDNYHLVEEQIREIRQDLPPGFYRQLPKLVGGPLLGYPRVFGIAWAFVAHTDSRLDPAALRRFLSAYQQVQPLTIGELWAVAITLRIVLVENLRRAAARSIVARAAREAADLLADRLLGLNGHPAEPHALRDHDAERGPEAGFTAQLLQRLRDQDPRETPALQSLEERLAARGTTAALIVSEEHQRQGASNVTVRNIITSMRLMSDIDWGELFEDVSLVDRALRAGGAFAAMDFATRNLYRGAIEQLARHAPLAELDVALRAAAAAASGEMTAQPGDDDRHADPGYRLVGAGRGAFERAIGYRPPLGRRLDRHVVAHGALHYIAAIVLLAAGLLLLGLLGTAPPGAPPRSLWLLALLGTIPALDAAVALVNRLVVRRVGVTLLPGLALRDGVPPALRTMVVVPILLTTAEAVAAAVDALEVHCLASPDGHLHFALLSDWVDAPAAAAADDEVLLDAGRTAVARLNERHAGIDGCPRFLLLHRRRLWCRTQQAWMGWERKRGKLHELNRLLRGATDTTYLGTGGAAPVVPADVRFVVTLDADTRLPRDAVRRLIGKMAHPLNRARFDPLRARVVDGYAVLQPRVTPSLPADREGSIYQRVHSSPPGIDPYAAAVSDVYQDLFGEGSYTGKGIYEIDPFEAALAGRVPDDTLLSHDLFEGTFARAGLATDIEVVEEFPSRYDVANARQHRWIRGDWQLLPWILGRRGTEALPLIARWKMLDNLRRSLSAPIAVAALAAGWTQPLPIALPWTLFVLGTIAVPALLPALGRLGRHRAGVTVRSHVRALRVDLSMAASQVALYVAFLPHQAASSADAIARSLYRVAVSRRHLLEWLTADQATAGSRRRLAGMYRYMGAGLGVAALAGLATGGGRVAVLATPLLAAWALAPALALWISRRTPVANRLAASAAERASLRQVARSTWRYFETFVTAADHSLPPDNFQEDPRATVAHRTSPTNIGLYLLATVAARDFGWLGVLDATERLEATLSSMARLQRHHGHFYNWYDTLDLRALEPRYVSSVDSGNLAAHLITLANALEGWARMQSWVPSTVDGIRDALELARQAVRATGRPRDADAVLHAELTAALAALDRVVATAWPRTAEADALLTRALPLADTAADAASALCGDAAPSELAFWTDATRQTIRSLLADMRLPAPRALELRARLAGLATTARQLAGAMDFAVLMNHERRLLSIGLRQADGGLDSGCYDLLASEARLASFIAIAKGDAPARHWFRLGRAGTPLGSGSALLSWSGSMFEYLMPSLVMRAPDGSLLEQTCRAVVRRQIEYATDAGIPWGISESAYTARDLEFTYQYSNFGVPGLGLKRGLGDNLVVAPYATALAAMIDTAAAVQNFAHLRDHGALGRYGYYEAVDYTRKRLPDDVQREVVRAYMAHHQGMTIVAIANVVFAGRMRARFHAEPAVRATELLLQERAPREVATAHPRAEGVAASARVPSGVTADVRRVLTPHDATPQTHLLSNGRYTVMMTAVGSGYTRWNDLAVTRWREDGTREDSGSYVYLRDVASGAVWSAGFQPSGVEPEEFAATFSEDRAVLFRRDGTLCSTLEVIVSPEDDADVRRVSVTNDGYRAREIEVTSYSEVVLATQAADLAHPAFSKLFVQTEFVPVSGALLATRRRRAAGDAEIWASHHAVVEGEVTAPVEVETDRARFLGRGREPRSARAAFDPAPLSNTVGTVLDPVFAIRQRLRIPAGATVRISFWTAVAASRAGVLDLVDKHREPNAFARAGTLAWTQAQVQLRHLGIDAAEVMLFQRLAGYVLFVDGALRPSSDALQRAMGPPEALWAHGISGDLPIVLLRISELEDIAIARQLLRAHEYWDTKQLAVDLVILNERSASYLQELEQALATAVRSSQSRPHAEAQSGRGSVYVLQVDRIAAATRDVLGAVARVVLNAARGSLEEQLDRSRQPPMEAVPSARRDAVRRRAPVQAPVPAALEFFNGIGGFGADGREYLTVLGGGQETPLPWINVIANENFGFQVAAEGGGFSWALNSRQNQLTPWSNDPVGDRPGEVLYLRDEETGELWGPTAAPIRDAASHYRAVHGQGYSRFEHTSHGIRLEMVQFVPLHDPLKVTRLTLRNESRWPRQLSVTAYTEWVLGASRSGSAPTIATAIDAETGAFIAGNAWNAAFGARVAFADLRGQQRDWTGDRRDFLGRHGSLAEPAALLRPGPLSRRVGVGLDPCCALQVPVALAPGASVEVVVLLGQAESLAAARELVRRFRDADLDAELRAVHAFWDRALGAVQVTTPDRALDLMFNRWLLYQTISCRLWARAAFYQASGAYGFRDQLQDGMAVATSAPALTRAHLLRAAGRQFAEGDVQHWWQPESGRGVRTRIADDRVWLAHAVAHYVAVTADAAVLDAEVPFLDGPRLAPGEHDAYFQPRRADDGASVYEHCARALDASLELGAHGLPLIGTGDWNDGMNLVGAAGRGESIWLGWLLYPTLTAFAPLAAQRDQAPRASRWLNHAAALRIALDSGGWDGEWYRRGYYDDGSALGSAADDECRIDSIAQSWSVISGAGEPDHAAAAMRALGRQLLRRDAGLALLFTPPFDRTLRDPGYVKGYPPGIRENGGQYAHAATWSVMAFALLGDGDTALEALSMLNPVRRSATRADVVRYKVEPYVVAADVYSVAPHVGRGGWTWYTGSAGAFYRATLEGLLGVHREGDSLRLDPCLPRSWPRVEVTLRHGSARYHIAIENPEGVCRGLRSVCIDGQPLASATAAFVLTDDGADHHVQAILGADGSAG